MRRPITLHVLVAGALLLLAAFAVVVLSRAGGVYGLFSDAETVPASLTAGTVEPPSGLTCRFLRFFRAELRWSPTTTGAAEGYRIYHRGPYPWSSSFRLLAEVPGAATTSYDRLRPSLLRHRYFLTAFLGSWESGPSNTIEVHCRPRLFHFPGPCCLKAENHHSQRTVELTWGSVMGATSYAVLRSTQSGGPYEVLATTGAPTHTDTTVGNGVTYHYLVVAVDAQGNESDPSAEVAVPDVVPTPSPTPTATPTPTPTVTSTPSPTPTATPTATDTPESSATNTAQPTATDTPAAAEAPTEPTSTADADS